MRARQGGSVVTQCCQGRNAVHRLTAITTAVAVKGDITGAQTATHSLALSIMGERGHKSLFENLFCLSVVVIKASELALAHIF